MRIDVRLVWVVASLAVALAACGGEALTVSEYAEAVEALVAQMEARFATLDAAWESEPPTVEGAEQYWVERLEIREDFLSGVEALRAPDAVGEMHATAIDVFGRITAADQALAARVAEYETLSSHREWLETPEGEATLTILEEVFAFCRASQAEFDATGEADSFGVASWLSPEQREAVRVAFGCPS